MSQRPIICVDLDGVLNTFDEWRGAEYFHPPRAGAAEFLERLNHLGYEVIIFTTRWAPHVQQWLEKYALAYYVSSVTDIKPPAHIFIDDRAICFRGDFEAALREIETFRTHWDPGHRPNINNSETNLT